MNKCKLTIAALAGVATLSSFSGTDSKTDSYKAHFITRAKGAIAVDGKFDEADWKSAEPITDWGITSFLWRPVVIPETWIKFLWDDKYLYVAMRCGEEDFPEENMKLFRRRDYDRSIAVYNRDCVELHLDGNNDRHTKYQIWFAPTEEKPITWYYDFGWGILTDHDYGANADWDYKVKVDDTGWQFEGRLALSHFELKPRVGYMFAAEPARFRMSKHMKGVDGKDLGITTRIWGWSTQGGDHFSGTAQYGKLIFVNDKPKDIVEGLRLVYPDLDERQIYVQTMTDYNLIEKGQVKKVPYLDKAKELFAATEKLMVRSEDLFREPAPKGTFQWASNNLVKTRGEFAKLQAKIAGKTTCDIATLNEITEWTKKKNPSIEADYWNALARLIRLEKKARHPVTLTVDPSLPPQSADEPTYPDPATRQYPQIDWAKNLAAKPAKSLIVVNNYGVYDAYALKSRLGIDADVFRARTEWMADGNDYWHEGFFPSSVMSRIFENMVATNNYENFIFLGYSPRHLLGRHQCWLLEQILAGRKLVIVGAGDNWEFGRELRLADELKAGSLKEIPALASAPENASGSHLFKMVPKPVSAAGISLAAFGKGTVAAYEAGHGQGYITHAAMSSCPWLKPNHAFDEEYLYGATVRAILQGLGLRGDRRAIALVVDNGGEVTANQPFAVTLATDGEKPWSGQVKYEVRDTWGKMVTSGRDGLQAVPGFKHHSLVVAGLPAGRYVVTMWMLDNAARVLDYAVAEIKAYDKIVSKCACNPACQLILPPAKIDEVKLAKGCFEERENIAATVKIANAAQGMCVEAAIRDPRNRIIEQARFPVSVTTGVASVTFAPKRLAAGCNFLEVRLVALNFGDAASRRVKNDFKILAAAEPIDFYRHIPRHDDYEAFTDPSVLGGMFGDRRDAILQHYGVKMFSALNGAIPYRGGTPMYEHLIDGNRSNKGGSMSSPWYAADLQRMYAREAQALKAINGHFISLGDDSGDPQSFGPSSPDWLPAFVESMREMFAAQQKAHPEKTLGQIIEEWGRSRKCGFVHNSIWRWGFEGPMMAHAKDLLQCDLQPDDIARFRSVLPRCYKSIERFNRHNGTNFKSYNEINAETIKTLKPHPMPEFLNFCYWLEERYAKDIAKLNQHWNSSFKDFFEITDEWIDDQKRRGNLVAAVLRTEFLEDNFIRQFQSIAAGVRSVDPSIGVGMCASGIGNALPEVIEHMNTVGPYLGGEEIEMARCLPHVYIGETIGVYGGRLMPLLMREREVYHGLFTGANFAWFWASMIAVSSDLSVHPARARRMLETIREVTRGTAALCVRAQRQNDGIRILASRTAGRLQPLKPNLGTHVAARRSFAAVVEDLGLQYDYLTTHQVEKGIPGDVKVLILASVQTLTDQEIQQIKAFARRGGHVLCDVEPAFADNYGKLLAKPSLEPSEYTILGFKPASYTFLRGRGELGTMRTEALAKFAAWGIKPQFKTLNAKGEEITNVEYSRFVRDGITCLGFEKIANGCETFPMAATLKLEKPQYVYEARSGKSYGLTDSVPLTLQGLDCKLFALLPYEVKGVAVDAPKSVKRGDTLTVKANVEKVGGESRSTKDVSTHVLRFELVPPGGYSEEKFAPVKPLVVDAPKGAATVEFPIAYNESVDHFDLVVTDVMTGKSATQRINLK